LKKKLEKKSNDSFNSKSHQSHSTLEIKKAKDWIKEAKTEAIPKKICGDFWYENELCILFAGTNVGKSILAVQIADAITKGKPILHFETEVQKQKVIYFDFELSKKQFEKRYSKEFENHYAFNNNFFRVEKDKRAMTDETNHYSTEALETDLTEMIVESNAKIIIIDNLSNLENNIEKSSSAIPLMKRLNGLKERYGISILLLAHTPKISSSKPITNNDLAGSKVLMNFCDSAFTIGASGLDKDIRYIKQIKVRAAEYKYDGENVFVCQLCKPKNFLQFEFLKFSGEEEHLKRLTNGDQETIITEVITLHQAGKSFREIGAVLGISHMKVSRILKQQSV
jgi:RecA-family ATPase